MPISTKIKKGIVFLHHKSWIKIKTDKFLLLSWLHLYSDFEKLIND